MSRPSVRPSGVLGSTLVATMESGLFLSFFAILSALLMGCSSGKLDRKTASAKISEHLATRGTSHDVYVGRIGTHCGFNPENHYEWSMDPDHDLGTVVAVKAGYVTVNPDGQDFWKVSLSAKGQGADAHQVKGRHVSLKGCDYTLMAIPVARPVLVKVTGILAENNSAVAEYEWKWMLTDLGRTLRENGSTYSQLSNDDRDRLREIFFIYDPVLPIPVPSDTDSNVHQGKATFIKYDDGWRLQLP